MLTKYFSVCHIVALINSLSGIAWGISDSNLTHKSDGQQRETFGSTSGNWSSKSQVRWDTYCGSDTTGNY